MVPVGGYGVGIATANSCISSDGDNFLETAFLFAAASPLPDGITAVTLSPNPTNNGWDLGPYEVVTYVKFTASASASAGGYPFNFTAALQGSCPQPGVALSPGYMQIVPGVTGPESDPDYVWWFDGLDPSPVDYPTTATLTLPDLSAQFELTFTWTITTGTSELAFTSNGQQSESITTTDPQVDVVSIGPSPMHSEIIDDITITVTAVGVHLQGYKQNPFTYYMSYAPFKMRVRTPYKNKKITNVDGAGCESLTKRYPGNENTGYSCYLYFETLDQDMQPLDSDSSNAPLPFNEFWSSQMDAPYANWSSVQTADSEKPSLWGDMLEAGQPPNYGGTCSNPAYVSGLLPSPIVPQATACDDVIMMNGTASSPGGWWVGSLTNGSGVQVQSQVWNLFLDHGAYSNVESPPSSQ